ncbi:MAG TPA: twin-arginine translocase subunit TatC [Anaerolineales bacterium]
MSAEVVPSKKPKRGWQDYLHAFGRAHRKASVEMESSAPLLQHLNELRNRLFKAFLALAVTTGLCFMFIEQIVDFLAAPVGGRQALVSIEITENISIFMKVSVLGGVILGMPVVIYQIMRFVLPGLKRNETVWLLVMVPFATLLFAAGVAFTWYIMLPSAIPFLTNFLGITTQVRPENYFDFITRLMFWIGLCFEMPLVVMFLAKLKIVSARQLIAAWRYAIVGMAVLAATVTPTVDPVNMGLVMAPLAGLYIISILLAALMRRGS